MFLILGSIVSLTIPSSHTWTYFDCKERASGRGIVVSTDDALITGVTVLSANDKLAEGIARCSHDNEANTVSTTSTIRKVKARFDHSDHKHSFLAYYG